MPIGRHVEVSAGLSARWSHTGDNEGRLIATLRDTLLGANDFGQLGGRVAADLDTRDRPVNPRRGIRLTAAGRVYPALWDVPGTFGAGEAEAAAFLSTPAPARATLALRVGGRKVWGTFPFHESAFLGGTSSLPGYHSNRFAGDASVYGGVQLRVTVGRTSLALPAIWGVFGNADAGRVYVNGRSPGGWHRGAGGGVWLAFLDRQNTVSFGITSTSEGTLAQTGVVFGY
jgi:outer membrane protein assembly factor BamA